MDNLRLPVMVRRLVVGWVSHLLAGLIGEYRFASLWHNIRDPLFPLGLQLDLFTDRLFSLPQLHGHSPLLLSELFSLGRHFKLIWVLVIRGQELHMCVRGRGEGVLIALLCNKGLNEGALD